MFFFNEIDIYCAQWLRNLYPGNKVSGECVSKLKPETLMDYKRVHLFAGIGGWEEALRLVHWPEDREVWTGSCPCQPFSAAGKRKGTSDARHLWPHMLKLIEKCRPATVFGEQVAGNLGREWLSRVRSDLEALGYAVGAADLTSASVGAPHRRNRLYWVANAPSPRRQGSERQEEPEKDWGSRLSPSRRFGRFWSNFKAVEGFDNRTDRKVFRRIEPGTKPLAHGVRCRSHKLRAYGNAIVPQVAAAFIQAFVESSY